MKLKFLLPFLLASVLFGADTANDLILTQRKPDNSGSIQRNVTPTANSLFGFSSSLLPVNVTAGTGLVLSSNSLSLASNLSIGTGSGTSLLLSGSTDATDATGLTGTLGTLGGLSVMKSGWFGGGVTAAGMNIIDGGVFRSLDDTDATDSTGTNGSFGTLGGISVAKSGRFGSVWATGNLTSSTPALSIATAVDPVNNSTSYGLSVVITDDTASTGATGPRGIYNNVTINRTSTNLRGASASYNELHVVGNVSSINQSGYQGVYGQMTLSHSVGTAPNVANAGVLGYGAASYADTGGTATRISGVVGQVVKGGNGTLTNLSAVYARMVSTTTSNLTNLVAFDYNGASTTGVENSYGLRLGNITGATNNYAIHTGTGLVRFGDNVQTTGTLTAGSNNIVLTDSLGKINSAALNTVGVEQGGTGLATLTANAVITGNGTGAVNFVSPGTSGNVLTSNGTAWTSAAPTGGGGGGTWGSITGTLSDQTDLSSALNAKAPTASPTFTGNATFSGNITATAGSNIVMYVANTASVNESVDVQALNNTTQTDNKYGLRSLMTVGNSNTSHGYRSGAILGEVMIASGNSQNYSGIQTGLYGLAHHEGSGTMGNLMAQYLVSGIYGTGNATEGFGQYVSGLQFAGSSGRFGTFYGSYFAPFAVSGSGLKPTNLYGYYFADNDGKADNVYAFYAAGNAASVFSGPTTVGSLSTGGAIVATGATPATSLGTGTVTVAGGMSVTKNIWLGQQLRFESSTDNTIGINFGGSSYLYQYGAGNVRLSSANFYLQGDFLPTASASFDLGSSGSKWRQLFVSGAASIGGTITAGSGPTTLTDSAGKILSAALNTVAVAQGGTGATDAATARTNLGLGNVENTALSTWSGSTNIVTTGNITTGTWSGTTVAVNKGGTGQTSYTNGQLLIGNTTSGGLDKASITAGTGITITNGAGSITINATASGGGGAAEKWDATFDGQGAVVSANVTVYRAVTTTGNITAGVLIGSRDDGASASGNATVSITRHTPSGGALGSGTALGNLTLSSAVHSRDTTLTGWTTKAVTAGDVLAIKTEAATTAATRLTVSLTQ